MNSLKFGLDVNGNKIVRFTPSSGRKGFSFQTLGNMPQTHRMKQDSIDYSVVMQELRLHASEVGTARQRRLLGVK